MPLAIFADIARWAGVTLSPPTAAPTGLEISPVVRSISGKLYRNISTSNPPASSTVYYGPNGMQSTRAAAGWFDTQQTGATSLEVSFFANLLSQGGGNGAYLDTSDDLVNGPFVNRVVYGGPNTFSTLSTSIVQRYWQIRYISGAINVTTFTLNSMEWNGTIGNLLDPVTGAQVLDGQTVADNFGTNTPPIGITIATNGANRQGSLAVSTMKAAGNASVQNNFVYDRTPVAFHGGQFSGSGSNTIWQPPSTQKARLMKYKIEVSADATIAGGAAPINLQFNQQLGAAAASALPFGTTIPYTHRLVIPGSTGSSFAGWDSGWIDLGNGILGPTAGKALQMGIQIPQSTAAITSPTWTIASNQWESASVGFKTNNNSGAFRLVQEAGAGNASSSASFVSLHMVTGNSYFVFFRTTNPAGGAPTVVVTDTALNTYTTGTLVTNASDGANGSSIGMAYVINAVGNNANVVTITTSVNLSTIVEGIIIEYAGVNSGGGIDAAQVSATGNSTSPASGNYTPATAGDLVFTFMGTAATLAAIPTAPAAFVQRGVPQALAQGGLSVADNFGNGSLLTGQINVIAIGTEE